VYDASPTLIFRRAKNICPFGFRHALCSNGTPPEQEARDALGCRNAAHHLRSNRATSGTGIALSRRAPRKRDAVPAVGTGRLRTAGDARRQSVQMAPRAYDLVF